MSGSHTPRRGSRVSAVHRPPNRFSIAKERLKRADVLTRIGLCLLAALAIWLTTQGWQPPFAFRLGEIPARGITSRVEFETEDRQATERAKQRAAARVVMIYRHDPSLLVQLREALYERVRQVLRAESYEQLDAGMWQEFLGGPDESSEGGLNPADRFQQFRDAVAEDETLENYKTAVITAMNSLDEKGILIKPGHDLTEAGNQGTIDVWVDANKPMQRVPIDEVYLDAVTKTLAARMEKVFASRVVADHTYWWLKGRLMETLTWDQGATREAAVVAADRVMPIMIKYPVGAILAEGGAPITADVLSLLEKEHETLRGRLTWVQKIARSMANLGMYTAIYLLCGFYSLFRQRHLLQDTKTLLRILLLVVVVIMFCWLTPRERPEAMIIPLLLFSMTVVTAYDQELALLLSTVVALVVVVAVGFGLTEFITYVSSMAAAVLCLRHVRSRTKLVYVGMVSALVGGATAIGVGTLADPVIDTHVLISAGWYSFLALLAGMLMTALLPFIEPLFEFQTELSLLVHADVAHPLLQELVRRAPGTYNHSITVASIAEAAADAIGANGLLVRVGAYFHDIGKMLKPGYFIENQRDGQNRHESLLPAMSTLVIIAHVKDGADLARQHNLPKSLVDFILQHHGTTLVEYFYNRASEQSESNPHGGTVDEHSYRYPGPKPQTKEAAVLMLSDIVESAGRSLADPTPARIESLVHDLAMKRLLDGQFDECGLTLQELRKIQVSLTKSLSAVYHGRIKYPDQQSA